MVFNPQSFSQGHLIIRFRGLKCTSWSYFLRRAAFQEPVQLKSHHQSSVLKKAESDSWTGSINLHIKQTLKVKLIQIIQGPLNGGLFRLLVPLGNY